MKKIFDKKQLEAKDFVDLHDMVDQIGERVARGETIADFVIPELHDVVDGSDDTMAKCVCSRYSARRGAEFVHFWTEQNPDCKYIHLQPLPNPYTIKI